MCTPITITDDDVGEPPEVFNVTLTTDDPETTLDPPVGIITIIDNDGEILFLTHNKTILL